MNWENIISILEEKLKELGYFKSSGLFNDGYISDTEPNKAFSIVPDTININDSQELGSLLNVEAILDLNILYLLLKTNNAKIISELENIIKYVELEYSNIQDIDNAMVIGTEKNIDAKGKGIIYTIKIKIQYSI